ncbi:helix-turn-helix domain-containing protein [Streptomyces sp. DSM 41524]|uniref:Helix-turn-helix domain-containing protein n=1 Tax=Streptomyces asiaticus subsp. ignotus TaxID=3098222 RepID=A0ABU7QAI4_9ACTN|nr:helix-turn-helix domain-containing protein [Streptomyces sp. DSM 41524]
MSQQPKTRTWQPMDHSSGVGVLDKTSALLDALAIGPATAPTLAARTGLTRPTTHRLLCALTKLDLATALGQTYALGPRAIRLAAAAQRVGQAHRTARIQLEMNKLCATPGVHAARLHQRHGPMLICVARATTRSRSSTHTTLLGAETPIGDDPVALTTLAWQAESVHAESTHGPGHALAPIRHQGWI